jgi:light-regulated signal transduction histidine kinase (bacteriophytochrome)
MNNTCFAPAERATTQSLKENFESINKIKYLKTVFDALPEVVAILNVQRQIVFGNKSLLNFLGLVEESGLLGLRPGEAMNCVNAFLTAGGCGTSENCRYCGAVQSIIESQKTFTKVTRECRITTKKEEVNGFLDLKITSTPVVFNDIKYTILSIDDISDSKRRQMLEKIFFHDVINIAGCLKGVTDILIETPHYSDSSNQYINIIGRMSNELLEEIMSQRALSFAENGDLMPNISDFTSLEILNEAVAYLGFHSVAKDKIICVDENAALLFISTDKVLLKRVLINLLKNALEASPANAIVTLDCYKKGDAVVFTVHNVNYMSDAVQSQVFQRSFSTKGSGRGLGTYSIKLLTERYLNGSVYFSTTEKKGTTFFVRIPNN